SGEMGRPGFRSGAPRSSTGARNWCSRSSTGARSSGPRVSPGRSGGMQELRWPSFGRGGAGRRSWSRGRSGTALRPIVRPSSWAGLAPPPSPTRSRPTGGWERDGVGSSRTRSAKGTCRLWASPETSSALGFRGSSAARHARGEVMERNLETSPPFDELLLGIWRQKRIVGICVAVALGLGALYGLLAPRKYVATAAVRMDAQVLPEQYVSPTVTETPESRIATIRYALLGEHVLGRIVREEGLFPELVRARGISAAVEALRARIEVRVEGENGYVVSYESRSAEEAARVANRIPEVYAEIASEERAEAAARAAAIFQAELENIRPQVEELESKLAAFKARHADRLPEVLESNLRQLDRLSGLTEATLLSLSDAQRRRSALART